MRYSSASAAGRAISRAPKPRLQANHYYSSSRPFSRFDPTCPSNSPSSLLESQKRAFHAAQPRKPCLTSLRQNPRSITPSLGPKLLALHQLQVRHCSCRRTMCRKHETDVADGNMDISKGREVLPKNVRPVHYDLTLEPDFTTFKYEGKVVIEYVMKQE